MTEEITSIPRHVGIIMDGNGRWATAKGKNRSYGHSEGSKNVDRIVSYAFERGIKALTLYVFSSENWSRPKDEVDKLMSLLQKTLSAVSALKTSYSTTLKTITTLAESYDGMMIGMKLKKR